MEAKPWYKSKTYWFNIACAAFANGAMLLPSLQGYLTPKTFAAFSTAVMVGNLILRKLTNRGITFNS